MKNSAPTPSSTGTGTGRKTGHGADRANGVDKTTGVSCDVNTCKYHGFMNCCNATGINVKNEAAQDKAETFCSTFDPKIQA